MRQREGMPQPREEQVGPQEAQPCAHTRGGGGGQCGPRGIRTPGHRCLGGGWAVSSGLCDQEPPGEHRVVSLHGERAG